MLGCAYITPPLFFFFSCLFHVFIMKEKVGQSEADCILNLFFSGPYSPYRLYALNHIARFRLGISFKKSQFENHLQIRASFGGLDLDRKSVV